MEKRKIKNQSNKENSLIRTLSIFVSLYLVVMSIFIYVWGAEQHNTKTISISLT